MRIKVNEVIRTHFATTTSRFVVALMGFIVLKLEFIPDHLTPHLAMTVPSVVGAIFDVVQISTREFTQMRAGNFSISAAGGIQLKTIDTRRYAEISLGRSNKRPLLRLTWEAVSPGTG